MSAEKKFFIKPVRWVDSDIRDVKDIRIKVFVEEQKIPFREEFDETDRTSYHVLALDGNGKPCGTGRLYADSLDPHLAHIGRMAVLPFARGQGCGSTILMALIDEAARQGFERIILSAQTSAAGFYERHGFAPIGEIFMDVNIPHVNMVRDV